MISIAFVVLLLIAACIFKFAMQGYSFIVYTCIFVSLLILVVTFAPLVVKRVFLAFTAMLIIAIAITEIPIVKASYGSSDGSQQYLIVLGAKVNGTEPSYSLSKRLEGALSYLQNNREAVCVVSGGQGPDEDISEAACMANWLQNHGIDGNRIILESASTSTDENIAFSYDAILSHLGYSKDFGYASLEGKVAIASSSYHLFRVELKAERYGFVPATVACNPGYPLLTFNYYLREAFAIWAQLIFT